MSMVMRFALVGAAVAVAVGVWIHEARAGFKANDQLVITSNTAKGAMGTVRASADSVQYLICSTNTFTVDGDVVDSMICFAKSASGVQRACGSFDPAYVANARSASGDSWVQFETDENSQCVDLLIENGSHLRPKTL